MHKIFTVLRIYLKNDNTFFFTKVIVKKLQLSDMVPRFSNNKKKRFQ